MNFRHLLPTLLAVLFSCFMPLGGFAQQKNNGNNNSRAAQERRDDAKIKDEREDINEAEKKRDAAVSKRKELAADHAKLEAAVTKTRATLEELRKRLEDQIGAKLGVPALAKTQSEAMQAYDAAAAPFVKKLDADPTYAAAKTAASTARQDLLQLKNQSLTEAQLTAKRAELNAKIEKPDLMKREALGQETSLIPLRQQADAAQEKLAKARDLVKSQVEANPDLQKALQAWEKSKREEQAGEAKVKAAERDVAAAEANIAQQRKQLQQATIRDKQNDQKQNNNNNNKNNNNKKK